MKMDKRNSAAAKAKAFQTFSYGKCENHER
jgi:hypothetical protein